MYLSSIRSRSNIRSSIHSVHWHIPIIEGSGKTVDLSILDLNRETKVIIGALSSGEATTEGSDGLITVFDHHNGAVKLIKRLIGNLECWI